MSGRSRGARQSPRRFHAQPLPTLGTAVGFGLCLALSALSSAATASETAAAIEGPHLPPAVPRVGPIRRGADGKIELIDPTKENGNAARRCSEGTICVGPGQGYATLAAALAAAHAGDVIEIVAGTYHEAAKITAPDVTLRGIAGRPHVDCDGIALADDKACLLIAADGVSLDNLEISGAVIAEGEGGNGACIRNEPNKSFTLRRVFCHESQEGILSDGGHIRIESSEFADNGWTERTHNVFFNGACSVEVLRSTFRDARIGHEFKSRCLKTVIADSVFRSTTGSRDLDIAAGGETRVYRSVFEKTAGAENHGIIAFGSESCANPGDMLLQAVRIINAAPAAELRNQCPGRRVILDAVQIEGIPPRQIGAFERRDDNTAYSELMAAPASQARQP